MTKRLTLLAAAARTANGNGTSIDISKYSKMVALLNITSSATDATDVLDVYVDFSLDGTVWYNGAHFAQQAGNGAAKREFVVFDRAAAPATTTVVTSDCGSGVVRPTVWGLFVRIRYTIADGSANANSSHNFSVTAEVQ